jgi:hypothetical protein
VATDLQLALLHGDRSVELFKLTERLEYVERIKQAARHPDELLVFVSLDMVDLLFSGDLLKYIDTRIAGNESLSVQEFLETMSDNSAR